MRTALSKLQKNEVKVIITLLTTCLLLEQINEALDLQADQSPAVTQATSYMDEVFEKYSAEETGEMKRRALLMRKRISKRVGGIPTDAGLVGALRFLTGGSFKTKKGTRLDYIVQTFATNLQNIEKVVPFDEQAANLFKSRMKSVVLSV